VDKNSPIGKSYLVNKNKSVFYKDAVFFGTEDLLELLKIQNLKLTIPIKLFSEI